MKQFKPFLLFLSLLLLFENKSIFCDDNYVFAPFISRLKAFEDNSSVKITWKDSRDIKGSYLIYRHTEPITRNNFADAFLVDEILPGTESYSDTVIPNTGFYYAVVVKNEKGDVFNIFLPYRNVTSKPVTVESINRIGDSAASVKYLTVTGKKDSLILSFSPSSSDRQLAVLRNIDPIFTADDIINSTILGIIPSHRKSYTDFPIPGVPCYYCIVDAELLKNLNVELIPFENTTLNAAEIPIPSGTLQLAALPEKRISPLPGYRLFNYLETGESIKTLLPEYSYSIRKLSQKTDAIIDSVLAKADVEYSMMETALLEQPETIPDDSEEKRLSIIIEKYINNNLWEEAEKSLSDLTRTSASKSFRNKAGYYLGQAYYFQGKSEKAYLEFLKSSESYYPESRKWMENILSLRSQKEKL